MSYSGLEARIHHGLALIRGQLNNLKSRSSRNGLQYSSTHVTKFILPPYQILRLDLSSRPLLNKSHFLKTRLGGVPDRRIYNIFKFIQVYLYIHPQSPTAPPQSVPSTNSSRDLDLGHLGISTLEFPIIVFGLSGFGSEVVHRLVRKLQSQGYADHVLKLCRYNPRPNTPQRRFRALATLKPQVIHHPATIRCSRSDTVQGSVYKGKQRPRPIPLLGRPCDWPRFFFHDDTQQDIISGEGTQEEARRKQPEVYCAGTYVCILPSLSYSCRASKEF
ncbi:hypothetical protein B0H16DRAFT_1485037 [Mycena metata]|uniref:Uncharacterized protein n=1 Tax=Mycena metata TaxID=1033252 RepID=A0AAD7DS02_9AGAR|nr:hypothetical protein B0H16DRAFT_1485037 [Mycena metata]